MNKLYFAKCVAIAAMLSATFAAAADYPASSYTLSTDGKTLQKWVGSETSIDMNSDAALAAVTTIADNAFYENSNLQSIVVGNSVTSIGRWSFLGCYSLQSATLPAGLTSIGIAAFSGCEALSQMAIPAGVTSLSNSLFYGCSSLANVTVPAGLTNIGSGAFSGCSSLTSFNVPAGITILNDEAFKDCTSLATVTLPEGMTEIGSSAFENCKGLKTLAFPSTLTDINSYAFAEAGLEHIDLSTITDEVYFGYNVFDGNVSLTSAILPPYISGGNTLFVNCTALEGIVIPQTWSSVPVKMCQYCSSLRTLDLGNVDYIKNTAFFDCTSLTDITWSPALTTIDWNVFYGCSSLTNLVLPASLETVDDYSFADLSSLRTLKIGANATYFGANCFNNLTSLESVYCEALTPPTLGTEAFYGTNQANATLYVPAGAMTAYGNASQWSAFGTIADIATGVKGVELSGMRILADRVEFGTTVARADLFSTAGVCMRSVVAADAISLEGIVPGVYVLSVEDNAVRIVVR